MVSITILMLLTFSKNFYTASITSYFTFYLIDRFQLSVQDAQFHLFVFLFAVAAGTLLGGPGGRPVRAQIRHLVLDPRRPCRSR